MPKPAAYPIPWCETLDAPYWQVNIYLCGLLEGWRIFQSRKDMAVIVNVIDTLIEKYPELIVKSEE